MIFRDLLEEKYKHLEPSFDELFNLVLRNQTHDCDLLLTKVNGNYNKDVSKADNLEYALSPYVIGAGMEGHSEKTHYSFINGYRISMALEVTYEDYLAEIQYSEEKRHERERIIKSEAATIQMEMLIYLKIWESDAIIKRFYQLARLIHGETYDWQFNFTPRSTVIKENVINRFKDKLPILYDAFVIGYETQIRNSIAHSNYSILNREICLNNQRLPSAPLFSIDFDNWIDRFHTTLAIYNAQIGFFNRVNEVYGLLAAQNENVLPVRVSVQVPSNTIEWREVEFDPLFKSWAWKRYSELE